MRTKTGVTISVITAVLLAAIPLAWAGNLVIKGSTTVLPIAQKVAEAYMKANPDVTISISGGGSGNGIKAIIDGDHRYRRQLALHQGQGSQAGRGKRGLPGTLRGGLRLHRAGGSPEQQRWPT